MTTVTERTIGKKRVIVATPKTPTSSNHEEEAKRLAKEAKQREAERIKAEKEEAKRLEAERVRAEKEEAKRLAKEARKQEAERLKAEKEEAKRIKREAWLAWRQRRYISKRRQFVTKAQAILYKLTIVQENKAFSIGCEDDLIRYVKKHNEKIGVAAIRIAIYNHIRRNWYYQRNLSKQKWRYHPVTGMRTSEIQPTERTFAVYLMGRISRRQKLEQQRRRERIERIKAARERVDAAKSIVETQTKVVEMKLLPYLTDNP